MKWFYCFIILHFGIAHAQEIQVIGRVTDSADNKPLAGAIIHIQNTNKISATSENGNFKIKFLGKGSYILSVSSVGFETKEVAISLPEIKDSILLVQLEPTIEDMEAIVVTGTRTEKKLKESPVLTQVIYPNKLKDIGITNVVAALEYEVPGLDFNSEQTPLRPSITFQGMNSKYILFLMDGERIAGELNGDIDYSMLNLNNVDRIEIVRGASSALYGSNAIGGVINIITRNPVIPFELNAFSKYSKFNKMESGTTILSKGEKISSISNITYGQTNGYELTPTSSTSWTQEKFKNISFNQKIEFNLFKNLSIFTNGGLYFNRIYDSHNAKSADDAYSDMSGNVRILYNLNGPDNLQLSYNADKYSSYGILVNANDKIIKTGYDILQDIRLTFYKEFGIHKLTFGFEYLPEQLKYELITAGVKNGYEWVSFVQNDFKLNNTFSAIVGFRTTDHSNYGLNLVPKIALMAHKNQVIYRLSYGLGYRSPTLKDLYYDFFHPAGGGFYIKGNQNLKPEKSEYIGISAEIDQKWINHSVNIYLNQIKNLISDNFTTDSSGRRIDTYFNDSSATIIGIDIMEKMSPFKNFIINLGISLVDARNSSSGRQLYNISPVSANISGSYSFQIFKNKTTVKVSGKYNGFRYYSPIPGEMMEFQDKPYNIWRAGLTQQFKSIFSFTLGIDNIFNVVNPSSFDNISPGRTFFISVNFKISKY